MTPEKIHITVEILLTKTLYDAATGKELVRKLQVATKSPAKSFDYRTTR